METRRLAYVSILIAIAIVLNIIENYLPLPFIAPGAKIGLANIVTMIGLLSIGYKDTFFMLLVRILLGSVYGGGLSGFLYSTAGGMLSFTMMILVMEVFRSHISTIGISVTGAVFHNVGQITVAILVLGNIKIISYMPVLTVVGVLAGSFVGLASKFFIKHLSKVYTISNDILMFSE